MLTRSYLGLGAFAIMAMASAMNANAAAIDYASSSNAIDEATSGLGAVLQSGAVKIIGIALGVWVIFFLVGKLRKTIK